MNDKPADGRPIRGPLGPHAGVDMAAISASMVAELRAKTDAPMMECKKALTEAEGDMTRAEEVLRVKLGNKAGKAAARMSGHGGDAAGLRAGGGGRAQGGGWQERREHVDPPIQALCRWRQARALSARYAHRRD